MLVLFETPAGYALFQVNDESKLSNVDNIHKLFSSSDSAQKIVSLKAFYKFENTTEALAAATALVESKLDKKLSKFLKKEFKSKKSQHLGIADSKLGAAIKEKLGITVAHDSSINELMRGIRQNIDSLIAGGSNAPSTADLHQMTLGLSHSLSRYKLKFSPDKVDVMIVQAVGLLDDLDKELNTYAMRVKEWYGWHFPEMVKIVTDNILYAKLIRHMGMRSRAAETDFASFLPEDQEAELREAAKLSMGTEISEHDLRNIVDLCSQVIDISEYREQLYEYLKNRMQAIAPNLSIMVGELVGARLIAHAGSLMNLAKYPASTVQILGAEKALFRALKTKQQTPKYGLIYHASLVGQAAPKNKGKVSRLLAARSALAIRVDALAETGGSSIGVEGRAKVEAKIKQLEEGRIHTISKVGSRSRTSTGAYESGRSSYNPSQVKTNTQYNTAADVAVSTPSPAASSKKRKRDEEVTPEKPAAETSASGNGGGEEKKKAKKEKKEKKAKKDKKSKKK